MNNLKLFMILFLFLSLFTTPFLLSCGEDDDSADYGNTNDGKNTDDERADSDDDASDEQQEDDDDTATDDDSSDDDDGSDDDDCPADFWPYSPADEMGPYDVGVTTVYLTDDDRFEIWGLRKRQLPLEIWYPSTGQGGHPNTLADMIGDIPDWGYQVFDSFYGEYFDEMIGIETAAMRDADLLDMDCPFPIVIFSHGMMAVRMQNFTLCEHLASHGFIVVAPDHYGNAVFTNVDGPEIVIYNPISTVFSYFDRPMDTHLVYQYMVAQNKNPESIWYENFDLDKIALTGHSFGGLTSMYAGAYYDYIKVIAPINPAWVGIFPQEFTKPFFLLQSQVDRIVGDFNHMPKARFDEAESKQKLFIDLIRGSHYSATDACVLLPPGYMSSSVSGCDDESFIDPAVANELTSAYLTAFIKTTMLDDERYNDYLTENHFEDEIEFSSTWEK